LDDPFNLQRFVFAQQAVYDNVLDELRAGRKQSHWMWFVFPQIRGLGHSAMAQKFAITSLEEARAYLLHPILGMRLRECSRIVADTEGRSINDIFGDPDNRKFHSCMTLFSKAAEENEIFRKCLRKYFSGQEDPQTLALIGA
jgi:uncharacterized protein (DUF1810 family)